MTHPSLTSPAWFGKLPGAGDFAHRRMPPTLRTRWDNWLHDGLAELRARHPGWIEAYLTSPVWGFLIGPGVAEDGTWIGAMAPSVDRVGRYYPIALFAPITLHESAPVVWWHAARHLLMQALESDADAHEFERLIANRFSHSETSSAPDSAVHISFPGIGQTIWTLASDPHLKPALEAKGLPSGPGFELLFDLQTTTAHLEDQP